MYSTLLNQPNLLYLSNIAHPRLFLFKILKQQKLRTFMLIRNPYARLVSFFVDKFRKQPQRINEDNFYWQECHKIFFSHLNISFNEDNKTISDKLLDFSFNHFIQLLPIVYRLDAHLWPQYYSYRVWWKNIPIMIWKIDKFIKIEDDMDFLKIHLKLDTSIRSNPSTYSSYNGTSKKESYEIINKIYGHDFRKFNYAQLN